MTTLARFDPSSLDVKDPSAMALALSEQGRSYLTHVTTMIEAKHALTFFKLLDAAVKLRDLNQEAVISASTNRIRAERRIGELLQAQAVSGERRLHGVRGPVKKDLGGVEVFLPPTLAQQGLTYDEASTYTKLAAKPPEKFEAAVAQVAKQATEGGHGVTRSAVLRELDPDGERTAGDRYKDVVRFKTACDRLVALNDAVLEALRWKAFPGPDVDPKVAQVLVLGLTLAIKHARETFTRIEHETHKRRR